MCVKVLLKCVKINGASILLRPVGPFPIMSSRHNLSHSNLQLFVCFFFQIFFFLLKVSECCDPNIRGILGSLPSIFMSFGILVSYIIGSLVKWNILAWYSCFMSGMCKYYTY